MNKETIEKTKAILRRTPANAGVLIEAAHRFQGKNSYPNYEVIYQEITKKKRITKHLPTRPMTAKETLQFNDLCDKIDDHINLHPYSKVAQRQMDDILTTLQYSQRLAKTQG